MTLPSQQPPRVAIACGGTGGHLFPGLAIAEQLVLRGCALTVIVSPKDVDQQAVKTATGMDIFTLPAVGLQAGGKIAFLRGFWQSYRASKRLFQRQAPWAVLAMGGFTGAPPILAAKKLGARTFLHESNAVPGRANRWLAWVVDRGFVGFAGAATALDRCEIVVTGTPVRSQFKRRDAATCRTALGLDPTRPVLLVMGGSQGAHAINQLLLESLPTLAQRVPGLQWLHLTGSLEANKVKEAYAALNLRAVVHPFLGEMELALGAATAAVGRAGASSLAELAAMRVPALLVPYPAATDHHQLRNARAFEATGAALLLEQSTVTPDTLARRIAELVGDQRRQGQMQAALAQWHHPHAAEQIAQAMLDATGARSGEAEPPQRGSGAFHPPEPSERARGARSPLLVPQMAAPPQPLTAALERLNR
ncbi:UDP-N-acetylglucosamine--N-acetylmuramyl-(pentapeptide) pyrophosphoryl-undecaprenol N-acetylglucosamine transferase [Verrucomicrobia bacterium]|nr:UDP-N-acetylglucosamine--N-acetylmuramyl-(pentapeptide) pyrophosphoryl-undecaprenol N-acetylglucosamine transferase [Verrucomicrobiota bacterium]